MLRYAHHEPIEKRSADYRPWVTAGVVSKVEGKYLYDVCERYRLAYDWYLTQVKKVA